MRRKRQNHSSAFKAKVALESVKGVLTTSELASKFNVHPSMIGKWKKQLLNSAPEVFESGQSSRINPSPETLTAPLYQEIGRLKMEVDFLKKKF